MDFSKACEINGDTVLYNIKNFSLPHMLDCGQAFRWEELEQNCWHGTATNRYCKISFHGDSATFHNTSLGDFESFWLDYFDLHTDYSQIKSLLSQDPTLAKAIEFSPGMRVLKQDSWEALCSFILSANNNIKRIKGIIKRLCETFGTAILHNGEIVSHSFPLAETIATLTVEDLQPLRSGFRAKYVVDAARLVADQLHGINLPSLKTLPIETAAKELMRIQGVGPKVADCALLYGCGRRECMPVDVWIKRVLETYYPNGLPEYALPIAGIAQQHLFHYIRNLN